MIGVKDGTPGLMPPRVSTGIQGLDEVLGGGLPRGNMYLVEGESGAGKTTLGLQFLPEGVGQGERVVYVMLSETTSEPRAIAQSYGWSLEGNGALMSEVNGH